ncbi:MAG: hypothetical protein EOM24_08845, partial [Chloroflexia bacterium]|nr:hypothetical protein [Chloroflexia bacterium]
MRSMALRMRWASARSAGLRRRASRIKAACSISKRLARLSSVCSISGSGLRPDKVISFRSQRSRLMVWLREQPFDASYSGRYYGQSWKESESTMPAIHALLPAYRSALVARGYRPRGIQKYLEQLRAFARFAGEDLPAETISAESITRYQEHLAARCGSGTVGNALTAIRSFCRWCATQGLRSDDPTLTIVWPRLRKPAPRALSHAELRRLLKAIEEPDELTELQRWVWGRNRRAVLLMLFAGLRISEVAALRWREVDLEAGVLLVIDG